MVDWSQESPVRVRLTRKQADRLRHDWYYRHASYEDLSDGQVLLTFGEDDRETVLELLRWLGPGAELLAPEEWRATLRKELRSMLADHGPAADEE